MNLSTKCNCPNCSYKIDAASSAITLNVYEPKQLPAVNDFSICLNCGRWLMFNDDLTVRIAPIDECTQLKKNNPDAFILLINLQNFILSRGKIR